MENEPTIETHKAGAQVHAGGVAYAVWAPDHAEMTVVVRRVRSGEATLQMARDEDGYFSVNDGDGRAGDRYGFLLPGGEVLPDPASRFQPEGVHENSEAIDARAYAWRTAHWRRPGWRGQSIYELHVGTFTAAGTFRAAIERLDHIAALGVEAIELMPLGDFPGERNWGYDGVAIYAPARCYGRPDDLRVLVDAAHERGLAVILDVVYNHLGPDGNYLRKFAAGYFDEDRHTPWGQAFRLTGEGSRPVRDFFVGNAAYWLDEFRFDGLRLDATHAIEDDSPTHLLAEIAAVARERGAFTIAEDERNSCGVLRREDGTGCGIDAVWADDFHHQVRVALTGVQESYFQSYRGTTTDLARTLGQGWFYAGEAFPQWKGRPRGEPCGHLAPSSFVYCIENHDQVGNRAAGERLEHLIAPSAFRAASALLCLSPYAPLIFMGQEWGAGTPFMFFTDHHGELGRLVSEGRKKEFGHGNGDVPDPQAEETFRRSKLSWEELRLYPHAKTMELYRECLQQRADWLRETADDRTRWRVEAYDRVIAIRYRGERDRLLVSSLQGDARFSLLNEEALRPPEGLAWRLEFESGPTVLNTTTVVDALVFGAPATVLLVAGTDGEGGAR